MAWFWDAYCPDESKRQEITASPLRASLDELAGLPEAFLIVDENDVLRDEGEAYARKLKDSGVDVASVRYDGMIHDFVLLNALRQLPGTEAAIEQASEGIRSHLSRSALRTNETNDSATACAAATGLVGSASRGVWTPALDHSPRRRD